MQVDSTRDTVGVNTEDSVVPPTVQQEGEHVPDMATAESQAYLEAEESTAFQTIIAYIRRPVEPAVGPQVQQPAATDERDAEINSMMADFDADSGGEITEEVAPPPSTTPTVQQEAEQELEQETQCMLQEHEEKFQNVLQEREQELFHEAMRNGSMDREFQLDSAAIEAMHANDRFPVGPVVVPQMPYCAVVYMSDAEIISMWVNVAAANKRFVEDCDL